MRKGTDGIILELKRLIENETFKLNEKLPPENDMAKLFGVSRVTYRVAVKHLEAEGKLFVKHGVGTFVVNPLPVIESDVQKLESIGAMIRHAGFKEHEKQEALDFVSCKESIAKQLQIAPHSTVVKLERYRIVNHEPVVYSMNYMPYHLVGKAFEDNQFSGSLFRFLMFHCNINILCADSEFCASAPGDSNAKKLISSGKESVILLKQLHYDQNNIPVLYSYDYLRNDIFKFQIRRRI
ncbi:GntR family transcriptional regulator [Vallitalea pronyensis]|uniref:GntR family transcriptional regulator n=1 Tax=Vallitalea pronyensis TaxID=1348613 RepID=A0A8J8SIW0_9FIRM|nr:GntR family transcriptional regulator [Vallitalea pronyensis]QUI25345.1 GntR family transcriptional regulator [Vallitalea pronyensis]